MVPAFTGLSAPHWDHYALSFGQADSWSLKYNLVWDRIWKSGLFSDRVYDKEIAFYLKKQNMYGIPLDSRAAYMKSYCGARLWQKRKRPWKP